MCYTEPLSRDNANAYMMDNGHVLVGYKAMVRFGPVLVSPWVASNYMSFDKLVPDIEVMRREFMPTRDTLFRVSGENLFKELDAAAREFPNAVQIPGRIIDCDIVANEHPFHVAATYASAFRMVPPEFKTSVRVAEFTDSDYAAMCRPDQPARNTTGFELTDKSICRDPFAIVKVLVPNHAAFGHESPYPDHVLSYMPLDSDREPTEQELQAVDDRNMRGYWGDMKEKSRGIYFKENAYG